MNNTKTFSILTLGCRVNQYESDCICEALRAAGMRRVDFGESCDVTVVNTCTVTAESDRKSRQMIRRAVASARHVIVTGCYAETAREKLRDIYGVSYVTGNSKKSDIAGVALRLADDIDVPSPELDINSAPFDTVEMSVPQRTRSYIKIEDGCDSHCSYCIIPKARGRVRSKPIESVEREAAALYEAGCREVILTGIETAAYGRDMGPSPYYGYALTEAIRRVSAVGYSRIGLGSLDPNVLNEGFVEAISAMPALLPHFHLSIQSGSSSVLARMRRKYNADQLRAGIARLRRAIPNVTLSADVIVGFPGESEEEFEETLRFADETKFLHLHIFPYSPRHGTEAASMSGQLTGDIKSARGARLAESQAKTKAALMDAYVAAHTTSPVEVLVEERKGEHLFGHSEHFAEVFLGGDDSLIERTVRVVLDSTDGDVCFGHVV